jgi:hypothetical protein
MKRISTEEMKNKPDWPNLLRLINDAMDKTKRDIGAKNIFLDDRGDRFVIVADGVDITEIGGEITE